jgi:hypothetical protein
VGRHRTGCDCRLCWNMRLKSQGLGVIRGRQVFRKGGEGVGKVRPVRKRKGKRSPSG